MEKTVAHLDVPPRPQDGSETLFEAVRGRLSCLIRRFDLNQDRARILDAFGWICRESLDLDRYRRPPEFSRINVDGTPIQFSLSLSPDGSPLQFLAEAGAPGSSVVERIDASRAAIGGIADLFGASDDLARVVDLQAEMADERDADLLANRSGVYWLGVSFAARRTPSLTVYINARWGSSAAQWARLRVLATWFGASESWRALEDRLRQEMAPLGAAITIAAGRPITGRVYTSAYGLKLEYYRALFDGHLDNQVDRFAQALLGEECGYPLRSAVCSFEFGPGGILGSKFELCAHCAFESDAEAACKCASWLQAAGCDPTLYTDTIRILAGKPLSNAKLPELHSHIGLGIRCGRLYSSAYLNPGPSLRGA
jgi:hypothetical protein